MQTGTDASVSSENSQRKFTWMGRFFFCLLACTWFDSTLTWDIKQGWEMSGKSGQTNPVLNPWKTAALLKFTVTQKFIVFLKNGIKSGSTSKNTGESGVEICFKIVRWKTKKCHTNCACTFSVVPSPPAGFCWICCILAYAMASPLRNTTEVSRNHFHTTAGAGGTESDPNLG